MKRGQSSIEFIVLLGFVIIVFIGFSLVIQMKIEEQYDLNKVDYMSQLSDLIEREFQLASRVRPFYIRQFELPVTIGGEAYDVELEDKNTLVITIASGQREYIRFLGVNITLTDVPLPSSSNSLLPKHDGEVVSRNVLIQKGEYGTLFVRRDCARNDISPEKCWPHPAE